MDVDRHAHLMADMFKAYRFKALIFTPITFAATGNVCDFLCFTTCKKSRLKAADWKTMLGNSCRKQ